MSKILHVYDLDNTLSKTLNFVDFLDVSDGQEIDVSKHYPEYFRAVRAAFWDKLSKPITFVRKGDFVVPINKSTGKHFDGSTIDYFGERRYQRMFEVINDILMVRSFPGFHSDPKTIGKEINVPVYEEYQKAENRMILTGRDEKLRPELELALKGMGIEYPNYGLKLYSGNEGIKNFKTRT